jgi:hypothetical protein
MNDTKHIGLDVHQATISAAILDGTGKLLMECIVETRAATILQFVHGFRGSLHVTLEEGTCAAWQVPFLCTIHPSNKIFQGCVAPSLHTIRIKRVFSTGNHFEDTFSHL